MTQTYNKLTVWDKEYRIYKQRIKLQQEALEAAMDYQLNKPWTLREKCNAILNYGSIGVLCILLGVLL